MLNYPTPAASMDVIAIDLLQLPASHQRSHYALVCVDYFSRLVILAFLENKSAEAIAHALITHVFCLFSTPCVLLSDNGAELKNHVLEAVCKYFGVTQTFIAACHPASNGLVERTNRKILEVLRPIVDSMQHVWQDWLPLVAASIYSSVCSSTRKSPHHILFGTDMRLPYDKLSQPPTPVYNVDDYAKKLTNVFTRIHSQIRNKLQTSRVEMTSQQHRRAHPISLLSGDVVMKLAPERSSKLLAKFLGSFTLVTKLHGNKFKIMDNATHATELAHADRLKKVSLKLVESLHEQQHCQQTDFQQQPGTNFPNNTYRSRLRSATKL